MASGLIVKSCSHFVSAIAIASVFQMVKRQLSSITNVSTVTTTDVIKLLRVREFCFTEKFCVKAKLLGTSAHLKIVHYSSTVTYQILRTEV